MAKNRIIGGRFQDAEGNPLANGYITMELCTDVQEPSGPSQVVGGLSLTINLDNSGNIADTISVWPNDLLNPTTSCYLVDAFTKDGTRAWKSPQYQKVLSSPSPFDISVWVPTPNGGCGCGNENSNIPRITLETNGAVNVNQLVENLIAGPGIGLVNDAGGGTTITANGVGITLQTNSVNNNSQTKLNLESTDSTVTLTDLGAGNINVQTQKILLQSNGVNNASQTKLNLRSTDGTVTVTDAGSGNVNLHCNPGAGSLFTVAPSWWGSGEGSPFTFSNSGNGLWCAPNATANTIKFWMVRIPYAIKITTITYYHLSSLGASHSAIGMYDSTGQTLLWSCNNFNTNVGAGAKHLTASPSGLIIGPGLFIMACGCDTISSNDPSTLGGYGTGGTNEPSEPWNTNGTARTGTAGNPLGGAATMPSALGTLNLSVNVGTAIPNFQMEP